MSAHKEWHPEKVRSQLTHPVIDGDGHWIEYGPVFVEQVRKAAGDKAADGLLRHMRRIPDALSLSIAAVARSRRLQGSLGVTGGLLLFSRSTTALSTDVLPTPPETTLAAFVGPEATASVRLGGAPIWLGLSVAADIAPGAPVLGYRRDAMVTPLHELSIFQPRAGLFVSFEP